MKMIDMFTNERLLQNFLFDSPSSWSFLHRYQKPTRDHMYDCVSGGVKYRYRNSFTFYVVRCFKATSHIKTNLKTNDTPIVYNDHYENMPTSTHNLCFGAKIR